MRGTPPNLRIPCTHPLPIFTAICFFLLLCPEPNLTSLPLPHLPRALISSEQVFVLTVRTVYSSLLSLPCRQLFAKTLAISFPSPQFIVSSIKSIYKSGSLSNCCATKMFYSVTFNSTCCFTACYSLSASLSVRREQHKAAKGYSKSIMMG